MVGWKNGTDQAALDMLRLYFSFDYPYYPLAYHRLVVPRVWKQNMTKQKQQCLKYWRVPALESRLNR